MLCDFKSENYLYGYQHTLIINTLKSLKNVLKQLFTVFI